MIPSPSASATSFPPIFDDPPRAAYIHVPFCRRRCGYCNFTVLAGHDHLADDYLDALEREVAELVEPRPVDSLFVGGGTPTHLSPRQLDRLTGMLAHWFPLQPGGEWTFEANPGDLVDGRLRVLAERGVNRLSLGVQSFSAEKLRRLERDHSPREARAAIDRARRWIGRIAIDLIFAAPGETLATWKADLRHALRLQVDHISTYGLTYERGTPFWSELLHGRLAEVDPQRQRAMYCHAIDTLEAHGLEHYEVSNFARPGERCRHNQVYWTGRSYYAAGAGAARYVGGCRSVNHRSARTYLRRVLAGLSPVAESECLEHSARARELMILLLRMREGLDEEAFRRRTGWSAEQLAGEPLERFCRSGWMERCGGRLRLTREGLLISDSLWPELV